MLDDVDDDVDVVDVVDVVVGFDLKTLMPLVILSPTTTMLM
jgi:hypothetical protein